MIKFNSALLFFLGFNLFISTVLKAGTGSDRIQINPQAAPFFHGVASGDPTSTSVILWTRITENIDTAFVNWEVALDTNFTNILASGDTMTTALTDYTVKVKAINLPQNTWMFYRFSHNGVLSPMGRTRTAPAGGINQLRFAVLSCSNFQDGFFNVYRDIVNKNDIDAVIHLGDYIYEYGIDDFSPGSDTSRLHEPAVEILNLEDYRIRHSQYKLDVDLQELHRQFPVITVWDDHETANNSWMGGAENHTPATEGLWADRRGAGVQAYFEWMPIEVVNNSIKRTFQWGDLVDMIMIDTRLEGREEQAGTSGAVVTDTNRTLLGSAQLSWLKSELSASNARWKLIGNQVMIAPLSIFGSAVNEDQWDGYPAERTNILSHIQNQGINNCVFLTGDIHTSWGNDVPLQTSNYNGSTGVGSVAVEFVCTSVTSSSFLTFTVPTAIIQIFNPHVKYAELSQRGYLLFDVDTQRVQGDWVYMSTVTDRNFTSSVNAARRCNFNQNHLENTIQFLTPRNINPPLAPEPNYQPLGINIAPPTPVILSISPNPASDFVGTQFYLPETSDLLFELLNAEGKICMSQKLTFPSGLGEIRFPVSSLIPGVHILRISSGKYNASARLIKSR
jgi:alkaline phosphatase D